MAGWRDRWESGESGETRGTMKWKGSSRGTGEHLLRERGGRGAIPPVPTPRVHIKTPCGKQVRTGWVVVRGERNDVRWLHTRWWMLGKATLMANGSGTDGLWFIHGSAVSPWEAVNSGFLYVTRGIAPWGVLTRSTPTEKWSHMCAVGFIW